MPAPVPFTAENVTGFVTTPPPRPPPPGSLPIMAELEWLRSAVEMQVRTIKYLLDNYNGLLAKVEAEGITTGGMSFGAPQTFAAGAIIAPGRYVAITSAAISVTPAAGTVLTLPAVASAIAPVTLMPVV